MFELPPGQLDPVAGEARDGLEPSSGMSTSSRLAFAAFIDYRVKDL
jgi:hypothetical protein